MGVSRPPICVTLTTMNPWEQLLTVQAIDTRIDQLDHRLAGLAERAALADVEARLAAHDEAITEVEGRRHLLQKEQKRLEDEIALIEEKKAKANDSLYAGGNNDTKQLQALQDEIRMHEGRITGLEDDELEIMEQLEPVDAELAGLRTERQAIEAAVEAAVVALAEAEADVTGARDEAVAEKATALEGVDDATVARYDKARATHGGVAVAALGPGGVCGACHMKLSAVEYDRIKHHPADEPVECEDCGRYLVRT